MRARFRAVSTSVPEVRRALHGALRDRVPPELLRDALLVGSELSTNAIRHAGLGPDDRFEVWTSLSPGVLKLEVIDGGMGFSKRPVSRTMHEATEGGRGLLLVEILSQRWGMLTGPAFGVWVELTHMRSGG